MKTRIVLVEPQYEENLGLIARAMKNFGFSELYLVNPQVNHWTGQSRSRAMHAQDVLKKVKKVKSLKAALKGTDLAVATTAITSRTKVNRSPITPAELAENYRETKGIMAVVFGRESDGLNNEEIKQCDVVVTIPSSKNYKTLNISHSAAVMFYELSKAGKERKKIASKQTRKMLIKEFERIIKTDKVKNPRGVKTAFKSFLAKSPLTEKEAKSLLAGFKAVNLKK
jgi:tRNA/rRNA methyltransferase